MGKRLKMYAIKKQNTPCAQFINRYFRIEILPIKRWHGFYSFSLKFQTKELVINYTSLFVVTTMQIYSCLIKKFFLQTKAGDL